MSDKLKVVKVNILGQDYFIKSSANQTYFKQVEEYINSKTEELIESGLNPDTEQLKIAVLACMNITDELFLYKNQKKEVLSKIESKSNALLEFIDEKLS
ncbi:cell division protein ZapA [Candidatus Marinimicrobia bacterium]|nr:cell division protein ZapA [Candidatus Neomarinimicrobiota bacterium]